MNECTINTFHSSSFAQEDDEGADQARLQYSRLQRLLNTDADVEDIIDNVLAAGEGNGAGAAAAASDGDFAFKKPVGRAPRAKKQKAPQG